MPRLPRCRRTATSCTSPAASTCPSRSPTGCAGSATARSCATGGPACTGAGRGSGTGGRRTCCAPTATTRTSRASRRRAGAGAAGVRAGRPEGRPGERRTGCTAGLGRDVVGGDRSPQPPRFARHDSPPLAAAPRQAGLLDRVRALAGCTRCRATRPPASAPWSTSYSRRSGTTVTVSATPAMPGRALRLRPRPVARCVGCRRCVYACVEENNQSRDPRDALDPRAGDGKARRGSTSTTPNPYYEPEPVPEEGHFYVPVACQQCRNAPCVKVCPTGATWTEPDGIVVIDYDWCIGCRYCMAACPYGARHFNWTEPAAARRRAQPEHARPRQPAAPGGRRREVHLLHPARARGPLPGLRRGLPGRRPQVRQPARPGQRGAGTSSSTSACSCSSRS